jgi:hypothetical protein
VTRSEKDMLTERSGDTMGAQTNSEKLVSEALAGVRYRISYL